MTVHHIVTRYELDDAFYEALEAKHFEAFHTYYTKDSRGLYRLERTFNDHGPLFLASAAFSLIDIWETSFLGPVPRKELTLLLLDADTSLEAQIVRAELMIAHMFERMEPLLTTEFRRNTFKYASQGCRPGQRFEVRNEDFSARCEMALEILGRRERQAFGEEDDAPPQYKNFRNALRAGTQLTNRVQDTIGLFYFYLRPFNERGAPEHETTSTATMALNDALRMFLGVDTRPEPSEYVLRNPDITNRLRYSAKFPRRRELAYPYPTPLLPQHHLLGSGE